MNIGKAAKLLEGVLGLLSSPEASSFVDEYVGIRKGEQNTQVKINVPGCTKDDIRVTIAGDKLNIYVKGKNVKSLFLTKSIDREKIESSVANGVLVVDFSKAMEFDEEEIQIK
jgi:HSP20 family molecular chaperone IbpA